MSPIADSAAPLIYSAWEEIRPGFSVGWLVLLVLGLLEEEDMVVV